MKKLTLAIIFSIAIILLSVIFVISKIQKPSTMNTPNTHLNWSEFQNMASEVNTLIIDIRTPDEIAQGKLFAEALELDYYAVDFEQKISELDPTKTYLIYCRSGGRSGSALSVLEKYDLSAFDLDGGYNAAR